MEHKDLIVGGKVCYLGHNETVLKLTSNSALITVTKKSDKGINCTQWLDNIQIQKQLKKPNQ